MAAAQPKSGTRVRNRRQALRSARQLPSFDTLQLSGIDDAALSVARQRTLMAAISDMARLLQ
jgi:hypothetical protein